MRQGPFLLHYSITAHIINGAHMKIQLRLNYNNFPGAFDDTPTLLDVMQQIITLGGATKLEVTDSSVYASFDNFDRAKEVGTHFRATASPNITVEL